MPDRFRPLFFFVLLALGCHALAAAQDGPSDDATGEDTVGPGYEIEIESSSHLVRADEDRLTFRWHGAAWDFTALYASVDSLDQVGFLAARDFGAGSLAAAVRWTDRTDGRDSLAGVYWRSDRADGSALGGELVFGTADLADDGFLVDDDEAQLAGRVFYEAPNGLEIQVFGARSGTYDVMLGARDLLKRLPRSRIAGAETLADLDIDEDLLEDSAGVRVAYGRDRLRGAFYAKSGEQAIRGIPEGDDMIGAGFELHYDGQAFDLDTTFDLRDLDTVDGIQFTRARLWLDLRHRIGPFEWGIGSYVQGESETFREIVDVYDTAGVGGTVQRRFENGDTWGLWLIAEDDAPDFRHATRLAVFRQRGSRKLGAGLRRDRIGRARDEELGGFVFAETVWKGLGIDGDVGFIDGDLYGRLLIGIRK